MTTSEALSIKDEQRTKAIIEADKRRDLLHARLPQIAEIDKKIKAVPFRVLNGESAETVRAETELLNTRRANLLIAAGYAPDYDEPVFECAECGDSGYRDGLKVCDCIKKMIASSNYAQSKLAKGLADKTFDNLSLSFYSEENDERLQMQSLINDCKRYAESFPSDSAAGLIFLGGTGLGKTHLSAAMANKIAAKGYSVVFESAQQILDTFEAVRFNRAEVFERRKYESCRLLIIDDLGAENTTQNTISTITSLIDLRMVNGLKTIITTNLNSAQIKKIYGERLFSRLLGEYRVCRFLGKDIRMQKLKSKK